MCGKQKMYYSLPQEQKKKKPSGVQQQKQWRNNPSSSQCLQETHENVTLKQKEPLCGQSTKT
jgi:hypothetical protein